MPRAPSPGDAGMTAREGGPSGSDGGVLCGAGTVEVDGACVPETEPVECGEGTVAVDGECVPEGESPDCGEGTVEVEGECAPAPTPRLRMSGFVLTQLRFETRGRTLTGEPTDPALSLHHPVDVSVAVRYEGDPATIPLIVALRESGEDADGFCLVGGVSLKHPGTGEVPVTQRMSLPESCLKDNTEDHSGTDDTERQMHPIVLVDPDDTLDEEGDLPHPIEFTEAKQEEALQAALARSTALAEDEEPEPLDPRLVSLSLCKREPGGTEGTCAVELRVEQSDGVDLELTDVQLESSVLVLNRCFADQAELETSAGEVDLPTGYLCNRSIVRGLDEEGQPLPEGDAKDYTYGAADVEVDTTVTAFGLEHSPVESADELMAMGEMTEEGFQLQVDPLDVVNNALGIEDTYTVRYFLRPASAALFDDAQDSSIAAAIERRGGFDALVGERTLLPIYLHAEGEQAKAGDGESLGAQERVALEETVAIPQTPNEYSHGLYVENDCGRFNDPTNRPDSYRPGTPACDPTVNARDELLYGDLSNERDFFVVACVTALEGEQLPETDDADNNCVERPLRVTRAVPRKQSWTNENPDSEDPNPFAGDPDAWTPGMTEDSLFSASDADGRSQSYDWNNGFGNEHLKLNVHAHTRNALGMAHGASTDNEAKLYLRSDTLDFSVDLVRAWAKANARTRIDGSYYDYGLEVFYSKLIGERREGNYHRTWDWNVTKEWGITVGFFVKIVKLEIGIKAGGQAGFRVAVDVEARNVDDPACSGEQCVALKNRYGAAHSVGQAGVSFGPYGLLRANLHAGVSLIVVRAGAGGELVLVELGVPASAGLSWGLNGDVDNLGEASMDVASWAKLELQSHFLDGRLYLFAEHRTVEFCTIDLWFFEIRIPCGFGWDRFWDWTFADWSGWTYNHTLWAAPEYTGTLGSWPESTEFGGELDPNTWYQVKAMHSNKCLDESAGNAVQQHCHGADWQRWRFTPLGGGLYKVENKHTHRVLDGAGSHNGANALTWPWHGGRNQQVRMEARGGGYRLSFLHSNRCIDVEGASHRNGANLLQWNCHGGNNQLFRLVP